MHVTDTAEHPSLGVLDIGSNTVRLVLFRRLSSNLTPEWLNWKECADNPVISQGGTWIYDRAAWCPGAPVDTKEFELTPVVMGQNEFAVDYDITYDPDGNYRFEGQIASRLHHLQYKCFNVFCIFQVCHKL